MKQRPLFVVCAFLGAGVFSVLVFHFSRSAFSFRPPGHDRLLLERAGTPPSAAAFNRPSAYGAALRADASTPSLEPVRSASRRGLNVESLRQWAETDPRAAAASVNRLPSGETRREAINAVAIIWANHDPAAASEWARQLADQEDCETGLASVAYEAARNDPVAALTLALELSAGAARDDLVTHAVAQWAASEAAAAADWAGKISDSALREQTMSIVATVWSESDPVAAAEYAVAMLPSGRVLDDAVIGIAQRWVQVEPEAAAAWVDEFPDGTLRMTALEILGQLWPLDPVYEASE
jgi:hypothetical protein